MVDKTKESLSCFLCYVNTIMCINVFSFRKSKMKSGKILELHLCTLPKT